MNVSRVLSWLLTLALFLSITGCDSGSGENSWQEQYDLGVRYLSEGNYEEAIIAFTAAIEIDPKRPEAYVGRGGAYIGSGETAENLAAALADYEAALELDETSADAWLGLADVYIRQGDYDKALEVLREGLDKTGGDQSIADKIKEMESGGISDSSGNLRRESHYDENGTLTAYFTYTYNNQGRTASVTGFDAAGNQAAHIDYVYDQTGKLLVDAGNYWIDIGRLDVREYEYDAAGNKVREIYHVSDSLDSEVDNYRVYTYDGEGNVTRQEYYFGTGELNMVKTYEYAGGLKTREDAYNGDGTLRYYHLYQYDDKGRMVREDTYDETGIFTAYDVYSYDEEGKFQSIETYDADGTLLRSTVYN